MKIPSNQLEAFFILSQERNFTKASKLIGLSQPAFSQRIQALEAFFETTLVIREKGNIKLTESGNKLLKYCHLNQQLENELLSEISVNSSNEFSGEIRLAGFSSVMRSIAMPSLKNLIATNKNILVTSITAELSELPSLLKSSKVDYIILDKPIEKEGLRSVLLGYEELVEITGKSDLDIYLDHDEFDTITTDFFKHFKITPPKKRRFFGDIYSIYDGVKHGLGNAIFPVHLIDSKKINIKNPKKVIKSPVFLVYNDSPYYTALQQKVIGEISEHFKQMLN
jgi:DNA-binding transcriptional LysR family regulator